MKIAVKVQLQSVEQPSRSDVGKQSMDLKPDNIGAELAANRWLQTKVSVAKLGLYYARSRANLHCLNVCVNYFVKVLNS